MQAKQLCRAGVISALYVALSLIFTPFAFGPIQVRPAEALCILPLLFPEAVLGLFVGCALTNLASPFLLYDVCLGGIATLLAGVGTYLIGKTVQNIPVKILVGGVFPVLVNAIVLPLVMAVICGQIGGYATTVSAYFAYAFSIFLTQTVWVYGLGTPLYLSLRKWQKHTGFLR